MDLIWYDAVYLHKRPAVVTPSISDKVNYAEPDLSAPSSRQGQSQDELSKPKTVSEPLTTIKSTIITLGDLIDTDALAPGPALTTCTTDEEFGQHCLEYTHPEFRDTVKSYPGSSAVVVGGYGFGVGSSRENAVSALKGCGVKCVISKNFAFIFGRNLPSLSLLGFNMTDESFYEAAKDGRNIEVDVQDRKVKIETQEGEWKEWPFELSEMEYQLTLNNGVTDAFKRFGKGIWKGMMPKGPEEGGKGSDFDARALQNVGEVGDENVMEKKMDW